MPFFRFGLGRRFISPRTRTAAPAAPAPATAGVPASRPGFLLVLLRALLRVGGVTLPPVRSAIVELGPVFDARECAGMIAGAGEGAPGWLWDRLAEALRASAGVQPSRLARPPVIDHFDPGGCRPPEPGGLTEVGDEGDCLVVVVFLNDDFVGGEVVCYAAEGPLTFPPRAGVAVAFPAFVVCEELPVRAGRKYVLRAEVILTTREG